MITKATLTSSSDAARYHDSALVEDGQSTSQKADNYYANETASAIWRGEGATILGIEGQQVTRDDFVGYLEGKINNPKDGTLQDLSENSKGDSRRLGYDFTISAPKSVSVVGLVGGDERVTAAHREANAAAMSWLEKNGAQIRVKNDDGSNRTVSTGNLLYATVQHETSRANDPQLHNHNVIIGVSYDKEKGEWRSLTNDELFRLRTTADAIYKNELARGLQKAGYALDFASDGRDFEIRGVNQEHLNTFSERSAQIVAALEQQGIDPSNASHAARQTAALDSRNKKVDLPKEKLHEIWNEKARETGLNLDEVIADARQRAQGIDLDSAENRLARIAVGRAIEHLSEREQAFKVADVEANAVYFGNAKVGIKSVQAAIDERRSDKSLVPRDNEKAPMLTTSAALAQELTLQDSISKGKGRGRTIISNEATFVEALAKFEARKTEEVGKPFKLSAEQVNAARNILMHEDKFQGIQGDAGTGKTASLEFVEEAARAQGWEMRGIASSTTAAKELQGATGIESSTIAAFMVERDKQMKMLQVEIDRLSIEIAHSPGNAAQIKQVEHREMNLAGAVGEPGQARYVFDNKSGNVYKSEIGPQNTLNILGHQLIEEGNQRISTAQTSLEQAERFGDRFKAMANSKAGDLQVALGRRLATYEQVGTVEAVAARTEHESQKIRDRNTLVRQYEVLTGQAENLARTGNIEGKKFLLIMDESSMTGTKDSARILEISREVGARVVLQGDTKQHGSVPAGRAFEQIQDAKINLSKIQETRRFDNATPQVKRAIEQMKIGNYATALEALDTHAVKSDRELYAKVAERYMENRDDLLAKGAHTPKVGIVTLTNTDRKEINIEVRAALRERGLITGAEVTKEHYDDPKMTTAERKYVRAIEDNNVNRMTALREYKNLGIASEENFKVVSFDREHNTVTLQRENGGKVIVDPSKMVNFSMAVSEDRNYATGDQVEARGNIGKKRDPGRVTNGTRGIVQEVTEKNTTIAWQDGKVSTFDNSQMRHVDHAYTHTSYKEQGVTNDREIFAVSDTGAKIINRQAAYVAASRAKGNTEIITTNVEEMLKNAGKVSEKTTATDIGKNLDVPDVTKMRGQSPKIEPTLDTAQTQDRKVDRTEEQTLSR